MIDFANHQGFVFMEIRDPEANLTLGECKELADYARLKSVEIVYALNSGVMAPRYFEVIARGIANTLVFDGPKIIRSGNNGPEFVNDEKKLYWTAEEFAVLVKNINQAGNMSKNLGVTLAVENAQEGLRGDGVKTFGTAELFGVQGVNANVDLQLDTGNFFCVSRVENHPNDVKEFFEQNVKRIAYTHFKSSIGGQTQAIISGNDLSLGTFLESLSEKSKVYVMIELLAAETLEEVYENHSKSITYLTSNY